MVDAGKKDAGDSARWAQAWIEQQRALLDAAARAGAQGDADVRAEAPWSKQWSELGSSYLSGMQQLLQNMGPSATNGNLPPASEMLERWRTAWSSSLARASAPGGWSDLLNRTPPLGLFREQTEALRAVVAAQADCQHLEQELAAVLRRVQSEALTLLEERVKAREQTGSPIQGFRDLYDLWVDCGEQVFSSVAHSSAYGHLQGELSNAAMRLRARMQKVIEQNLKQFDLPTRSELNSVHVQLRSMRQRIAALEGAGSPVVRPASASRSSVKGAPSARSAKVKTTAVPAKRVASRKTSARTRRKSR